MSLEVFVTSTKQDRNYYGSVRSHLECNFIRNLYRILVSGFVESPTILLYELEIFVYSWFGFAVSLIHFCKQNYGRSFTAIMARVQSANKTMVTLL